MKTRKFIQIAFIIILIAIATIFLVFYRPVFLWGDTYYLPVLSKSMEPTIPEGGVAVIKQTDPATLQTGDIICFSPSKNQPWVTHRITNITNEGFITKGDANDDMDHWTVERENVIGKATFTIPYLGYISQFVRTPAGFILLIIIPATLLIIGEIRNIIKYQKEEKKEVKN
jgi:signal peptidase